MAKKFLLAVAPEIPTSERLALEKHLKEGLRDSEYTVITNYDLQVGIVKVRKGELVTVSAPGVPVAEVKDLRKRIRKALDKKRIHPVVCNYDVVITTEQVL